MGVAVSPNRGQSRNQTVFILWLWSGSRTDRVNTKTALLLGVFDHPKLVIICDKKGEFDGSGNYNSLTAAFSAYVRRLREPSFGKFGIANYYAGRMVKERLSSHLPE
jgi:hypothetical protein